MAKKSDLVNMGFGDNEIPYSLADYCDLVDATGRTIISGKIGSIPINLPPILKRLNLNKSTSLDELNQFKNNGQTAVGTV